MKRRKYPTHIYVAGLQAGGAVKVGITKDPVRRLASLRGVWPGQDLALFFAQEMSSPEAIEGRALRLLADHRIAGEWFSVTPEAAIAAVKVAMKQEADAARPKPIRLLTRPRGSALAEITAEMRKVLDDHRAAGLEVPKPMARHYFALLTGTLRLARGLEPLKPRQTRARIGQTVPKIGQTVIEG